MKIACAGRSWLADRKLLSDRTNYGSVNGNNYSQLINNGLNWSEWNVRGDYDITHVEPGHFPLDQRFVDQSGARTMVPRSGASPISRRSIRPGASLPEASWPNSVRPSPTPWSTTSNSASGKTALSPHSREPSAGNVPLLQAAYPATFPASIKQKDEFFGGWGGLNPYGYIGGANGGGSGTTSMWNIAPYGNHEDLYSVQDNISKVHGNHLLKAGIFLSIDEKVESNGAGADRPVLPGNCTTSATAFCDNTNNSLATILLPGTGPNAQVYTGVTENSIDGIADVHWHDIEPYFGDSWKIKRNLSIDYGFRWSILREPFGGTSGGNTSPAYDQGGNYPNQWANWSLGAWSASEAATNPGDACNGILTVPGTTPCANQTKFLAGLGVTANLSNGTPGPNASLVQQNSHSIAPRVGVSWDIFGNGKTAVRVGGGQFFERELVGIAENLARNAPFVLGISTNRSLDAVTPLTSASVSPSANKDTGGFIPNAWQWNVSVEQEVARNTTIQVGYVGNTGVHLTSMRDANAVTDNNWLAGAFVTVGERRTHFVLRITSG